MHHVQRFLGGMCTTIVIACSGTSGNDLVTNQALLGPDAGDAGSVSTVDAGSVTTVLNDDACPAQPPKHATACAVAGGIRCDYPYCDQQGPASATCLGGQWQVVHSAAPCLSREDTAPCRDARQAWANAAAALQQSPGTCNVDTDCTWVYQPYVTCFQGSFVASKGSLTGSLGDALDAASRTVSAHCPVPNGACGAAQPDVRCDLTTNRCGTK
jgi:hypothetical protein